MKKVSSQSITGQLGANLIERIVLQMRYIWRPLLIFDVGIDGEIEIRDPVTGEATNSIVRVQAKATTQMFQAETDTSFEFVCEQKDIDYWLQGNTPVILVVCRPETEEAYWISIKDYFKDTNSLKSRKVFFNKNKNIFNASCGHEIKNLALEKDSGLYFAPLAKTELLFTNLLHVNSFAPNIYIAETKYRKPGEIWQKLKSMGVKVGGEWILANKKIVSFQNLDEYPFHQICDLGSLETFESAEWSETDDDDKKKDFVRLLNLSLRERTHLQGLRFEEKFEYYFFPFIGNFKTRRIEYQSIQRRTRREVFKQYTKKNDLPQRAYCRHSAFKGFFQRYKNQWYLEITPTYHFTSDGIRTDRFRENRLKGIKRLERNPGVLGHLLMWISYLRRPIKSLFSSEYPFLSFGDLMMVEFGTSIPDSIWYQAEDADESQNIKAIVNQLDLLTHEN